MHLRPPAAWLLFSTQLAAGNTLNRAVTTPRVYEDRTIEPTRGTTIYVKFEQQGAPTNATQSPPAWMQSFQGPECARRRAVDLGSESPLYCNPNATVLYSPSLRLAYVYNELVATQSWEEYFASLSDTMAIDTGDDAWTDQLAPGTFFFTFTREPTDKLIQAYAEVDLGQRASLRRQERRPGFKPGNLTYTEVGRKHRHGVDRFSAYLQDLVDGRFPTVGWRYSGQSAQSQLANVCTHPMNYIGRLEKVTEHWDIIQDLAQVPAVNRTVAVLHTQKQTSSTGSRSLGPSDGIVDRVVIDPDERVIMDAEAADVFVADVGVSPKGTETDIARYRADLRVERSAVFHQRLCEVYYADFACLGYDIPRRCRSMRERAERRDLTHPFMTLNRAT